MLNPRCHRWCWTAPSGRSMVGVLSAGEGTILLSCTTRRSRSMRWVTKAFVPERLCKSVLLMSVMYGFLCVPPLPAEPVKVAVLLPFSGVYKENGGAAKNGFLLGLKKEASEAKVNIESWVTFDFLDSRADADHSLALAKQAIGDGA